MLVFNGVPCFTLGWFLSLTLRHMHEKNGPANFAEDRTNGEGFNSRHTHTHTSPHLDLFFSSVAISIFFILLIFFKSQKSSMYWKYSILPYFKDCAFVLPHLRQALRRVWCNLRANILCKHPAPCTVVLSYSQIPHVGTQQWMVPTKTMCMDALPNLPLTAGSCDPYLTFQSGAGRRLVEIVTQPQLYTDIQIIFLLFLLPSVLRSLRMNRSVTKQDSRCHDFLGLRIIQPWR